jgi:hypothetical protein
VVTPRKQRFDSIPGTLGVLVCTDKYLDHVVNLTTAAFAKGLVVSLFFTGKGVLLTMQPQFSKLVGKCTLGVCDMSFRACGLHGKEHLIPGSTQNDFTTQAANAEMQARSDRHLVF